MRGGDDGDSELEDFVEQQTTPAPDKEAFEAALSAEVGTALSTLNTRERRIMKLRFGIG